MAREREAVELEVGERRLRLTHPDRVYFPALRATKLDLARYYLEVGEGIVRALAERPCMLHRYPSGVGGQKVHQKRLPAGAPEWVQTVRVNFPRHGRHADELCVTELASVIWAVQMSTVEFHPWNSRRDDVEHPDEWRIDIDPMPDCPFETVRRVARVVRELLDELGIVGWLKTSGGSGLHVYVRIEPRWSFEQVRLAALAFAREVQRRAPRLATTTWWRREREPDRAFVDYNQNARDHTIACAYSVRGVAQATVSAPLAWEELDDVEPGDLTIATMPERFRRLGDLHAAIDERSFSLEPLLEWAEREPPGAEAGPGEQALGGP
jgi:DNA ligase D